MLEKLNNQFVLKNPDGAAQLLLSYRDDAAYKRAVYKYGPSIVCTLQNVPSIMDKINITNDMDAFDTMCIHRYVEEKIDECANGDNLTSHRAYQDLLKFENKLVSADTIKNLPLIRANTLSFVHSTIEGVVTACAPIAQYAGTVSPMNAHIKRHSNVSKLMDDYNISNMFLFNDAHIEDSLDQYFSSIFSTDVDDITPLESVQNLNTILEALTKLDGIEKYDAIAKLYGFIYQSDKKAVYESYIKYYLSGDILSVSTDDLMPLIESMLVSSDVDIDTAMSRSHELDALIQKRADDAKDNADMNIDAIHNYLKLHPEFDDSPFTANLYISQNNISDENITCVNDMIAIQGANNLIIPVYNKIVNAPYLIRLNAHGKVNAERMN